MKRKTQAMYRRIAEAIKEKAVFSIKEDNESGFKTIAELITSYLLRQYEIGDGLRLFSVLLPIVKRSFYSAIEFLELEGIPVYKYAPEGKRNLEYISIKGDYRKAQTRDTDRRKHQVKTKVDKIIGHLTISNPAVLLEFKQKLLEGNVYDPTKAEVRITD